MATQKSSKTPPERRSQSAFLRFRVENFRSLRDEIELSAVASSLSDAQDDLIALPATIPSVLPVLAIYGANASGKSSVLSAIDYMCRAVSASQRAWNPDGGIPREPFLLDTESVGRPSLFEMEMVVRGTRYTYGFLVDSTRVLEEWLFAYPKGRKQEWLVRDDESFKFSRDLPGENAIIQRLTRPNSLFLSAAAQNNHEALRPIFSWFASAVRFVSPEKRENQQNRAANFVKQEEYEESILKLLKLADLGVTNIEVVREELPDEMKRMIERVAGEDKGMLATLQKNPYITRIALHHSTGGTKSTVLPFERESAGTRALLALAGPAVRALKHGGVLMVDEIDASLHPLLALELVRLFQRADSNPRRAQLIFNTHDTNLLDCELLRRDQVWFAEKNPNGVTNVYSLTEYHPRRDENVKRGYLQGRYGAVPFLTGAQTVLETSVTDDTKK